MPPNIDFFSSSTDVACYLDKEPKILLKSIYTKILPF